MRSRLVAKKLCQFADEWYESKRAANGTVTTNVATVGLILSEYVREGLPMEPDRYAAGSQVRGLSGSKIQGMLEKHGEERSFTSEGGRTSRGSLPMAQELAQRLSVAGKALGFNELSFSDRNWISEELQMLFVKKIQIDYFGRQHISATVDPAWPVRRAIEAILGEAILRRSNVAGAVAQHLVGAKLQLRFPDEKIENNGYTTADQQTGRPGDFTVGDTSIHVTMAPSEALLKKCQANLRDNFRVLILVPDKSLQAARQLALNAGLAEWVSVQSVEDYVGTNVEEMAGLTANGCRLGLRALFETYNDRVTAVEPDPSLRIVIPVNL